MASELLWTRDGLTRLGFHGWITFRDLQRAHLPNTQGVYVVTRTGTAAPTFLERSVGGPHKGRDLTVPVARLRESWTDDAQILYIGKASSLRTRLWAYARQGRGHSASHYGGRFLWQLPQSEELVVGWREVVTARPGDVEDALITLYAANFGRRPFANLNGGRAMSVAFARAVVGAEFDVTV